MRHNNRLFALSKLNYFLNICVFLKDAYCTYDGKTELKDGKYLSKTCFKKK